MAERLDLPKFPFNIPWFLYDIDNNQLITSPIQPGDISDTKEIVYATINIPGLDYQPVQYGYGGSEIISFSLSIINRNNTLGNILLLKQFEMLRFQASGITKIKKDRNRANPKVLFNWGTGKSPLEYYVTKCDFVHKADYVNQLGNPTNTEVSITLKKDGTSILNKAEEAFREFSALAGLIVNNLNIIDSQVTGASII